MYKDFPYFVNGLRLREPISDARWKISEEEAKTTNARRNALSGGGSRRVVKRGRDAAHVPGGETAVMGKSSSWGRTIFKLARRVD